MDNANTAQSAPSASLERVQIGEKTYHLIGTAHISQASVDLVEKVIHELRPDAVAVELCQPRLESLKDPERWKNTDIVAVLRAGQGYVLMAQLILASFQRRIGKNINVKPGAEMLRALACAQELGCSVALIDRPIRTTLKRAWSALRLRSLFTLMWGAFEDSKGENEITTEEIERLKQSDALHAALAEFTAEFPQLQKILIDERDRYMAAKLQQVPGKTIVGVVGAGHVSGIKRYLDTTIELAALDELPPPSRWGKFMQWLIPLVVVGLLFAAFFTSGEKMALSMATTWIVVTGVFAALGSLIALAHPLSILVAFVSAPITTLHPLLASGWFAGLTEALIRRPRVVDFEHVTEDLSSVRGIWRNRVSKIILVMALTNLTGFVGALIGVGKIAALLGH